jgi:tRNA(adenine34) deaminase
MQDEDFMRLAIEEAAEGDRKPGGGEVGCVIVRDGRVVARAHNEAELQHDPTAHAEIVALRKLGRELRSVEFPGCTLYCTLQPCGMCTMASIWAKVSRIVYGAGRSDVHSIYFEQRHRDTADFIGDAFHADIDVRGGVLAEECARFYSRPADNPPEAARKPSEPSLLGIIESSLYVEDLERSCSFYQRLFGFEILYEERPRMVAMSAAGKQVLLLFRKGGSLQPTQSSGGLIPAHDGDGNLHLAFAIDRAEVEPWERRLEALGIPIESKVQCGSTGTSLYFRDPDGHALELITQGCWKIW